MTGGFAAGRVVHIEKVARVDVSGSYSQATYLNMFQGSGGPGVTLFDDVLDLSVYYRSATLQYRSVYGNVAAAPLGVRVERKMTTVRLSLPTVLVLVAVVGAGAFAAGQSVSPDSSSPFSSPPASFAAAPTETAEPQADIPELPMENDDLLPPGHPPTSGAGAMATGALPAGHPPVDPMGQAVAEMAPPDPHPAAQAPLEWQMPARWQLVPNASKFRLATYRVPHAPGDADDAELSVTRAGGSIDANAERWIGQFDAAGQKTAKRALRMVGGLQATMVEARGNYAGGMGKGGSSGSDWALLGAIVSTPGMPHFFKLTGPAKTVLAARGEFDAMIASLVQR